MPSSHGATTTTIGVKATSSLTEWQKHKCACVHPDPYECARLRDGRPDPDDEDRHRRACECCCHDDYEPDDDEL
jgi:hypothetical protein